MDKTNNFALFVDLENTGGKVSTLNSIIEKVKIRGNILIGRVYGYTDGFSPLKELLLSNTFYVVPSIRHGHNQKNHLDIQLVIDALDTAYTNTLIDSYCIVSGDSDYTPLVGKLKSMGKFVMGISRSEVASGVFINACNEFLFLESVSTAKPKARKKNGDASSDASELCKLIETILADQANPDGTVYASELKGALMRLRPDFNERSYGHSSFGKVLFDLEKKYGTFHVISDSYSLRVKLLSEEGAQNTPTVNKENWMSVFRAQLARLKDDGFERVNPSILKAAITNEYPDFDERVIGYKKFSDLLKGLEQEGAVKVEFDEAHSMLVRIM